MYCNGVDVVVELIKIEQMEGGQKGLRVVEPTMATGEEKESIVAETRLFMEKRQKGLRVAEPITTVEDDQKESTVETRMALKEALSQPSRFFPCSKKHTYLDLCQEHYLVMWNSGTRNYSDYKKDTYKGSSTDFTYILHTS